jgi:hypothetical protein
MTTTATTTTTTPILVGRLTLTGDWAGGGEGGGGVSTTTTVLQFDPAADSSGEQRHTRPADFQVDASGGDHHDDGDDDDDDDDDQLISTTFTASSLAARVPDVQLWWPLHYGTPHLHAITAHVAWRWQEEEDDKDDSLSSSSSAMITKRVGFRSVSLFTGSAPAPLPARVDPSHAADYVGCFRNGNPYWGCPAGFSPTCQNALPFSPKRSSISGSGSGSGIGSTSNSNADGGNDDPNMTVGKCIELCANGGEGGGGGGEGGVDAAAAEATTPTTPVYALAGLLDSTQCRCGAAIGKECTGCLPLVGTPADPTECGAPCGGDAGVACGGSSYMWGSLSVCVSFTVWVIPW